MWNSWFSGDSWRIIRILAEEGPIRRYMLIGREGMSKSSIYKVIKKLEENNNVRVMRHSKWKAKGNTGRYVLTFSGLVKYLAQRFPDSNIDRDKVKVVIEKYGKVIRYPLFLEHETLAEWLGDRVYDWFVSAAHLITFKEPVIKTVSHNNLVLLDAPRIDWFKTEKKQIHDYTLQLIKIIYKHVKGRKINPIGNLELADFFIATFEKEISKTIKFSDFLETLRACFEFQFAPGV